MTKDALRFEARSRLAGLDPLARERAGAAAARHVWTLPELADARVILLYAALPTEMPTAAIDAEARRRGIVVTYPRCLVATGEMSLHLVGSDEDLADGGSYGLREPLASCPLVEVSEIDAALAPGLAWDRRGARLGRGAGYYDRIFGDARWSGFRCGLFFAIQEVPAVPTDAWDVALDAVVTEKGAWRM
jgi:5-formyltetrahydrofolate cyclo-ligase